MVFDRFFRPASGERFDQEWGNAAWKILLVITLNQVKESGRYHCAACRDVRLTPKGRLDRHGARARPGIELDVDSVFAVREALESLPPELRRGAVRFRLEGYTVSEIANRLDLPLRTIERDPTCNRTQEMERLPGVRGNGARPGDPVAIRARLPKKGQPSPTRFATPSAIPTSQDPDIPANSCDCWTPPGRAGGGSISVRSPITETETPIRSALFPTPSVPPRRNGVGRHGPVDVCCTTARAPTSRFT